MYLIGTPIQQLDEEDSNAAEPLRAPLWNYVVSRALQCDIRLTHDLAQAARPATHARVHACTLTSPQPSPTPM